MFIRRCTAIISLALIAVAVPKAVAAQAAELLGGTWKLNAEKSTYDPAALAIKSGTVTYTFSGNKVTAAIDQVNARGEKVHIEYTATVDGADHPWTGTVDGKPIAGQDAVSFRKLNDRTYHIENKFKGKLLTTNHIVVAPDGKSRTSTTTGTNPQGQKVNNVVVYEKQ